MKLVTRGDHGPSFEATGPETMRPQTRAVPQSQNCQVVLTGMPGLALSSDRPLQVFYSKIGSRVQCWQLFMSIKGAGLSKGQSEIGRSSVIAVVRKYIAGVTPRAMESRP